MKFEPNKTYTITSQIFGTGDVGEIVWTIQGVTSNVPDDQNYMKIIGRKNNNRIEMYIRKDYIVPPKNFEKYKVFMSSSNGTGIFGETCRISLCWCYRDILVF